MANSHHLYRAPFPWFGGKSRAASLIWERFGDVANYVEPFAGSLAVLLARPHEPRVETVNDKDAYLANFWRAVQAAPEEVARYADWPVNEADLHARHRWLLAQEDFRERMLTDPDFYSTKIAGWWVWGLCSWIGSGWCDVSRWPVIQLPHLGDAGRGVHRKLPRLDGSGGAGVAGSAIGDLTVYFTALAARLRRVRVACGEWDRVIGPSVLRSWGGTTGVLLDPPYAEGNVAYGVGDDRSLSAKVREWAIAHANDFGLRIALCGYEGEHELPGTWECVAWKARGGYAGQGDGSNNNAHRERIWFSPGCLKGGQLALFEEA